MGKGVGRSWKFQGSTLKGGKNREKKIARSAGRFLIMVWNSGDSEKEKGVGWVVLGRVFWVQIRVDGHRIASGGGR